LAARLAKAKDAHDEVVSACHKAMADALVIERQAQIRLASEYDLAQSRGEVAVPGGSGSNQYANVQRENICNTVEDIGLTRKQIHEARFWRDAERDNPGVVRRTLDAISAAGKEPTRAELRRAIAPKPSSPPSLPPQPMPPPHPAAEGEAQDDEEGDRLHRAYSRLSVVIEWRRERATAGADQDQWDDVGEAFEAMGAFVMSTLDWIDDGKLTVTGTQLEKWNELKSVMEVIFPKSVD
jgi:hypothetical protein